MVTASEAKKQAEADLRHAKILTDISSQLSHGFRDINIQIINFAKAIGVADRVLEGKRTEAAKLAKHDKDQLRKAKEVAAGLQKLNATKHAQLLDEIREKRIDKDARNRNRLDEIRTQGENVRFNLKMRQLYKDQSESFSSVMKMMGGTTVKGLAFGGLEKGFNTLRLGSEILETNKNLQTAQEDVKAKKNTINTGKVWEMDMKKLTDRVDRLTEVLKEQREKLGVFGRWGGEGANDSKWARRLEPIISWAKKNKTGIIISAASIGLLIMSFKKLLSVSPMLQKMLEIMGLSFNLILRPFGDFIGFILRPIAMMMLSTVMPFFREAYPFLMTLGSAMGEKFAKGDILGGLGLMFEAISPFDVLKWLFGDREGNVEGGIGAVGAALGAGVLGLFSAVVVSLWKMTNWVRAFLGLKPNPSPTVISSASSSSSTGSGNPNWRDGKQSGSGWRPHHYSNTPSSPLGRIDTIKSTIGNVLDTLKHGKFNTLASIRGGGTGSTAYMVSQLLDNVPLFKQAKLDFWKMWRDADGRNDPSRAWMGYDEYGRGIGVPDYSQQYPYAHNVDSNGVPINININIDNVANATDVDYLMKEMVQEMETSNVMQDGN